MEEDLPMLRLLFFASMLLWGAACHAAEVNQNPLDPETLEAFRHAEVVVIGSLGNAQEEPARGSEQTLVASLKVLKVFKGPEGTEALSIRLLKRTASHKLTMYNGDESGLWLLQRAPDKDAIYVPGEAESLVLNGVGSDGDGREPPPPKEAVAHRKIFSEGEGKRIEAYLEALKPEVTTIDGLAQAALLGRVRVFRLSGGLQRVVRLQRADRPDMSTWQIATSRYTSVGIGQAPFDLVSLHPEDALTLSKTKVDHAFDVIPLLNRAGRGWELSGAALVAVDAPAPKAER